MKRPTAALAIVLLLNACGGSSDRADQLEALEQQTLELGGGANPFADVTPQQEACLEDEAPGLDFVSALTDSSAAGVAQRVTMTEAVITCLPDLRENEVFVEQITGTFNAALGGVADIDTDEGGCMLGYILDNSDNPARTLADGSSEADSQIFLDGIPECFDAETIAVMFGDEGAGPQAYGDDARLDSLYDDCKLGDDRACDILYFDANPTSEYSALGADCAGRGDGISFCTTGFEVDAAGTVSATSPGLAILEQGCIGGDMTSCDLLYRTSPLGSELEQLGFTCGGKIVAGGLPDCRTRFPS